MSVRDNLIQWVKYNYIILNNLPFDNESILKFKNVRDELKKQGVESILISEIKEDSYTISYIENFSKKEYIIYVSDFQI
ncbi:hypothetical protein [Petroclostridium sp. X23]|uniref:hypothetical protein n=1 Tax=Petroclostridium sp. X23 TaxID=3045146 RepID=UPI0024AC86D1|nr:hypothetical protein [Petroclostridium sp. X23]WHH60951.1 hypothetical protein QKW49_09695 [Petroclostridium sp. X23]